MPFPYKKMTQADFDYIRSVTGDNRVWVVDAIAKVETGSRGMHQDVPTENVVMLDVIEE